METTSTGPLIPRRLLGAAFRELREARNETLQQAAHACLFSPSKLSRIENGLAGEPHPRDVRDLIAHFEVAEGRVAELARLAEAGRVPGWWQTGEYRMPSRLDTFISYESAATRIDAYLPAAVPGLLQTRDYSAALFERLLPHLSADEINHQVEIRARRQEHARQHPPQQHYVVPETVLRRRVGSVETMRDQLGHLVEAYDKRHIELHVIPFSAGLYEAAELSEITMFEFGTDQALDVVAIERTRFVQFLDKPETVAKYRGVLGRLSRYWLDRSESLAFIDDIRTHG
jgi:transcriptional regulator with XRE-family HTH domain